MHPNRDIQNPLGKHFCNLKVAGGLDPSNPDNSMISAYIATWQSHNMLVRWVLGILYFQSISGCQAIHCFTVPCHCCLLTALLKCAMQCDAEFQWESSALDCAAGPWLSLALCGYLTQWLVSVDLFAYATSETTYKLQLKSAG